MAYIELLQPAFKVGDLVNELSGSAEPSSSVIVWKVVGIAISLDTYLVSPKEEHNIVMPVFDYQLEYKDNATGVTYFFTSSADWMVKARI